MISAKMVEECRIVFMLLFSIFVIWSVAIWCKQFTQQRIGLRDWSGMLGVSLAICSTIPYAVLYLFFLARHSLIAHGSALWAIYYSGEAAAVLGFTLGVFGFARLRFYSLIISIVMAFQWWREMTPSFRFGAVITLFMFLSLTVVVGVLLGSRYFSSRMKWGQS
jgi:hypothetical protein